MLALNSFCQTHHFKPPKIETVITGPPHAPTWYAFSEFMEDQFRGPTKREAKQACAEALLKLLEEQERKEEMTKLEKVDKPVPTCANIEQSLKEQQFYGEILNEQNALKILQEHFQHLGLALPSFTFKSSGPPHAREFSAKLDGYEFMGKAKTKRDCQIQCALHYLRTFGISHLTDFRLPLPTFSVKPSAISFNPLRVTPWPSGLASLDLEWDNERQFVCASVARSEDEIYVFTKIALLMEHLRTVTCCIVFASINDRKFFPDIFSNLNITDLRDILPEGKFSSTVGLRHLARYCLNVHHDKTYQTSFHGGQVLSPAQLKYVCSDALLTLLIYWHFTNDRVVESK
jgi:hypothetical protein